MIPQAARTWHGMAGMAAWLGRQLRINDASGKRRVLEAGNPWFDRMDR